MPRRLLDFHVNRRSVVWALPALVLVALGCAAISRPHGGPSNTAPQATSSTSSASIASVVSSDASVSPPAPPPVVFSGEPVEFDPNRLVPILDDPRLTAVKDAATKEEYTEAAKVLDAVLSAEPRPSMDDERAFRFQLGHLRALAGDPLGAARAFEAAAALGGPLEGYARFQAADLLVRAEKPAEALPHIERIPADLPIGTSLTLLRADALLGKGDLEAAMPHYRAYLGKSGHPTRWVEVALKVGRALLQKPSEEHAEEAIGLARRVMYEGPSGAGHVEAKAIENDALGSLPFPRRKAFETPTQDELFARAKNQLEAGQLREAIATTDALIADPLAASPGEFACNVWLVRADALAKQKKKRNEGAVAYGTAIERCAGASRRVDALWQGGRAAGRASLHSDAVLRYGMLEQEFKTHRLADDARLKGAYAVKELGDEVRFTQMLTTMPDDYPEGDMVNDGLFQLALTRMVKRDWAGAIAPLERGLARAPHERVYYSAGRFPYYLARAKLETGAADKGKALLTSVINDYPLSFYMALAYARLAELDAEGAKKVLADALAKEGQAGAPTVPKSPAFGMPEFVRAVELARQGESRFARFELDRLGVGARTAPPEVLWAAALLFSRAGSPKEAHQILRTATNTSTAMQSEFTDWTDHYPGGPWRNAWEIAFPRPYLPFVSAETKRSGIPEGLAYSIMREESAFDPRVVSAADAVGLMQLIVPTAKRMGKSLNLPGDAESLKKPAINIALGCRYLSILRNMFPDNPLMAIPGYNAGGGKPKDWINERPNEDFDLWVEEMPYEETRLYTKRVITSLAAYEVLYGNAPGEALGMPLAASPNARKAAATLAAP